MGSVVAISRACTGSRAAGEAARIVVLPFRPVGGEAREIVDGITYATRLRLGEVKGIEVVGQFTSSAEVLQGMTPSAIADSIGVDYVLEATVEWDSASDSVDVRPKLFGANGTRIGLWRERPIRLSVASLSDVEHTIAGDVARALDLTVGQAARADLTPPQLDPEAYVAYSQGMQAKGEARTAHLENVLALDPTFAPAHAALAEDALHRVLTSRSSKDSADLCDHALAAIQNGPGLPDGYMWMGVYHRTVTRDADSALGYLKKARDLAPGNAEVMHFLSSAFSVDGQLDSALEMARRGAVLDPLNPSTVSRVSRVLLFEHSLHEAWELHSEARPQAIQQRVHHRLGGRLSDPRRHG